jgi:hypothetical protein
VLEELASGYARFARDTGPALSAWSAFWRRVNERLGYDHLGLATALPEGRRMIDDDGIPVLQYVALLRTAGFARVDILRREGSVVTLAAVRD